MTNKEWMTYISRLRAVNDIAAKKMADYLSQFTIWDLPEHRQEIVNYAYGLATKYGEVAAELACQMHEGMARYGKVTIPAAEPAETATYSEVAKAVNGTMKTGNPDIMSSVVGKLVKRTGVDTAMKNAIRDGAEWAWIPSGDTCAFCLTLASRGWQRASKKAIKNGHAEHIHANCDCMYAVRFDSRENVEGYDPEELQAAYYQADGNTPKERINSMRRELYAQNKDKINAQKRAAYARRTEKRNAQVLYKSRVSNTEQQLKTLSNSKIIECEDHEDIITLFNRSHGIQVDGFTNEDLFKTKAVLSGCDDFLNTFGSCNVRKIVYDETLEYLGLYDRVARIVYIGKDGLGSYGTGLHEFAHALDVANSLPAKNNFSEGIVNDAIKNLKLKRNSKQYVNMAFQIVQDNGIIKSNPKEFYAYAMETAMGGIDNALADEILRITKTKVK